MLYELLVFTRVNRGWNAVALHIPYLEILLEHGWIPGIGKASRPSTGEMKMKTLDERKSRDLDPRKRENAFPLMSYI